jgi:hypothetical protein
MSDPREAMLAAELRGHESQAAIKPGPQRDHLAQHQHLIVRARVANGVALDAKPEPTPEGKRL